jgi:hypothetical protein
MMSVAFWRDHQVSTENQLSLKAKVIELQFRVQELEF